MLDMALKVTGLLVLLVALYLLVAVAIGLNAVLPGDPLKESGAGWQYRTLPDQSPDGKGGTK